MKQWATAIFILSICSSMAFAEDWVEVRKEKGLGMTLFVDDDTIKTEYGTTKTFWVMAEYKTPQKAPNKKLYIENKARMKIDCTGETIIEMEFFAYNKNGGLVYSQTEWLPKAPVIPGSIGDTLKEYVCE